MKIWLTVFAILFSLGYCVGLDFSRTLIRGNTHSVSLWRGTHVVAASTDGWVCYDDGDSVACHRAIPKPTYKEIR